MRRSTGPVVIDPSQLLRAGQTASLRMPPPRRPSALGRKHSPPYRVRGRASAGHRQTGGLGGASRRRAQVGHSGQCADRPLRRWSFRHRRCAAPRGSSIVSIRAPRGFWSSRRRMRRIRDWPGFLPITGKPCRSHVRIWRSSGASRHGHQAPSTPRSPATP